MGSPNGTTHPACPAATGPPYRTPIWQRSIAIGACCVLAALVISSCGPRLKLEPVTTTTITPEGYGGGAAPAVPLPTARVGIPADKMTAPKPEPPRQPSEPATSTALPTTAPAATRSTTTTTSAAHPQPKRYRCDWMENFEQGRAGRPAQWIILDTGAWGRAEVPGNRIWIAPRTPCDKVYSVAVHEWTHHMQGVVYRTWAEVQRELAPYGGPEMVADCGALLLGATWIRYGCPGRFSTEAAAAILRGERP